MQTPYASVLECTFSDPGIDTDELRRSFYGQNDHVRLYGRDMFARMERAGFTVTIRAHRDVLAEYDPQYHGVNEREGLILVAKR